MQHVAIHRKIYREFCLFLALLMIFMGVPFQYVHGAPAAEVDFGWTGQYERSTTPGVPVATTAGAMGVDYDISYYQITTNTAISLVSGANLNGVKVYINGKIQEDETSKFNISTTGTSTPGGIKFTLKQAPVVQLRKHTLYTIYIPQGILENASGQVNKATYYSFVTKGEDTNIYKDNILAKATPIDNETEVPNQTNQIVFEFVGEIDAAYSLPKVTSGAAIKSSPVTTPALSGYTSTTPAAIGNDDNQFPDHFTAEIIQNKLVFKPKVNILKDFGNYTVTLPADVIRLKNEGNNPIANAEIQIGFSTDQWIASTYPVYHATNVGVEPTIQFHFTYPVSSSIDKSRIQMRTIENELYPLDANAISLTNGNKTLVIDIDDKGNEIDQLKKNTTYIVEVLPNALTLENITSPLMQIQFTTGTAGEYPVPNAYGSSISFGDDIREISRTNLMENGEIFLRFNTPIQWDKDWGGDGNATKRAAGIRLEKVITTSSSSKPNYSPTGVQFDKEYTYDRQNDGSIQASAINEMIEIERVDIAGPNSIKIKPKYGLQLLSQYRIHIPKEMIEDTYGYNCRNDIGFEFWTRSGGLGTAPVWRSWDVSETNSTAIIRGTDGVYKNEKTYNTPRYSHTKPIVLNISGEVIPSASEGTTAGQNRALERITLYPANEGEESINNISATHTMDIRIGAKAKLNLTESLSQGGNITWLSQNPGIASVDQSGRILGINRGTATIVAIKGSNPISTITINVVKSVFEKTDTTENFVKKIQFEYVFENNVKNTRMYVYLNDGMMLESGKHYQLTIPGNVLQSRNGQILQTMELNFVTAGSTTGSPNIGIERVENTITSVSDLAYSSEHVLWIYGYNFNEQIKSLSIGSFTVGRQDIEYIDVDRIKVSLRGSTKDQIVQDSYSSEKTYDLVLTFDWNGTDVPAAGNFNFQVKPMGAPVVISRYPDSNGSFDEKSLRHPVSDSFTNGKYFIRLTFRDADGNLEFNGDTGLVNIINSSVVAVGSESSMIDNDAIQEIRNKGEFDRNAAIQKYLFVKNASTKEATLYIPVKPLRTQTTYQTIVRAGIIKAGSLQNGEITYSFQTKATPYITSVDIGSVVENYDINQPIILKGEFFDGSGIQVYFNDIPAYSVSVGSTTGTNGSITERYLKVYLPRGNAKLQAGVYSVKIATGANHQTVEYGVFSVVPGGKGTAPSEDYRIKNKPREGEVRGDIKRSEDTLLLDSRYVNDTYLTLNLDDLMGENVWGRKIEYVGDKRDKIGILETKSKWANISLYGLTLDSSAKENTITLNLGRTESEKIQSLQKKLKGNVKSDFIQVTGSNYKVQSIALWIPYSNTNGKNIKVYRYDEDTRSFYEIKGTVNLVDKRVEVMSNQPGIFVVVE